MKKLLCFIVLVENWLISIVEIVACRVKTVVSYSFFDVRWQFDFLHQMAHLLYLLFKLNSLFFGLLFKRLNLIVGFISVFIRIVSSFDNIGHFFSFLVQLTFKLLIEIVKNDSFLSQRVNDMFKIPIDGDGLVILLISLIESIF